MTRYIAPPSSATRPALVVRASRGLLRQLAEFVAALRDRSEVKRLIELDDRALKDIGLSRSEVDGALAEPFFRSPSRVLLRSVERRSRAVQTTAPAERSARPVVPLVRQACA